MPTIGDNCGRSPISTAIGGVVQQTRVLDQECVFIIIWSMKCRTGSLVCV